MYQNNAAREPVHRYYRCACSGWTVPTGIARTDSLLAPKVLEHIVIDIIKSAVTKPDSKKAIVSAIKRRGQGLR